MSRRKRLAFYAWVLERALGEGEDAYRDLRRALCRQDLFYLLVFELNRADLNHDWLYARCCEVQQEPDERLDLWAREHGKSSLITFGKTIQDILRDPEITVGIFSHTKPIAKGFLRTIKNEFQNNGALKQLFPDILWQ